MTTRNRITRGRQRLAARMATIASRGQMGQIRETELARLTGARR